MTIRESDLREMARMQKFAAYEVLAESHKLKARISHKRAFLSHSHLDQELAMGLKRKLASTGITLYIDWLDLTMPARTNVETARKIQEAISSCDYFLYLVTANSSKSIWCPWELGYADGIKRMSRNQIYVVPTIGDDNLERGKEYLGLYRVMDMYRKEDGVDKFVFYDVQDLSKRYYFED